MRKLICLVFLFLSTFLLADADLSQSAHAQTFEISVPVKATYLHVDSYDYLNGALDATPIELSTLGIYEGDWLLLEALGDIKRGIYFSDDWTRMIGVFSSSSVLLSYTNLNRVQDAIDAGTDEITSNTFDLNEPTDIAEDFRIFHETDVDQTILQVPINATYLFVAARDNRYFDNSDPDNDFAVRITVVPEPISLALFIIGGATLGFRRYCKKRRGNV